ncbi:MAG: FAD-dependent oxidoreductase, partial [Synergistes sp.]|nr:FAD-dependent oxidoreductase [Synergistes sp.]
MALYDYLIVGAGFFGAVFAYEAARRGKKCLVLDRRPHIGGNAACVNISSIAVHKYGAHIFHTDSRVIWSFINRFSEFNGFINSPVANCGGR